MFARIRQNGVNEVLIAAYQRIVSFHIGFPSDVGYFRISDIRVSRICVYRHTRGLNKLCAGRRNQLRIILLNNGIDICAHIASVRRAVGHNVVSGDEVDLS